MAEEIESAGSRGDFIRFEGIAKSFGGVTALDDVSLSIGRGECHGLMGENGAGKSTLGKILAGIHRPDRGELVIDGKLQAFSSPRDAMKARVAMVHQELAFCPDLSVAENLSLGQYPRRGGLLLDRRQMIERAEKLLSAIGVSLEVTQSMRALLTAQEQLVQIAAAIGSDPRILIFDEPTSSLAEPDAQNLFRLIEKLKFRGLTLIHVSHRMPELFRLCDKISVLRDGRYVGTLDREEMNHDAVVRMMIGRTVEEYFPQHLSASDGNVVVKARALSTRIIVMREGRIAGELSRDEASQETVLRLMAGIVPRSE